jgi:hypothetical protein
MAFADAVVEFAGDVVELGLRDMTQALALWQVLPDESVDVLDRPFW